MTITAGIVSGPPTGGLHLGNLLGAILRWYACRRSAPVAEFIFQPISTR